MANDFSGDANCVAVYRFENGALTTDSKGTNTLSSNGTPISVTGAGEFKEGSGAVDFEAADTGDYYSIADSALASGFPLKSGETNTAISVCFWAKLESTSAQVIFASKYDTAAKRSFSIGTTAPTLKARLAIGYNSGNSAEAIDHASTLGSGIWYHFGVTYDGPTKAYLIRIWDDTAGAILGTDKTGTSTNSIYISTAAFAIGAYAVASGWMDGIIDEVAIFNDILTTDEIDQIRAGTYGAAGGGTVVPALDEGMLMGGFMPMAGGLC